MKTNGIVFLAIAIVAIGIFALPSTVSLFSGQHTWYDLGSPENDVPCEKCHMDIADEMAGSANGVHTNMTCTMCHRTPFTGATYATGHIDSPPTNPIPGQEVHAASMVECMDCHGGVEDGGAHASNPEYSGNCMDCHKYGFVDFVTAGGFGLTNESWDTGSKATHIPFVMDAINDSMMAGANEACIACHCDVGVNITWDVNTNMSFAASENEDGNWTVSDFKAH